MQARLQTRVYLLYSQTIRTRRHFPKENEQSVRIVEGLRECGARSSPSIINDTRFSVNRAAIFRQENEQSVRIVEGLRECGARSSPVSLMIQGYGKNKFSLSILFKIISYSFSLMSYSFAIIKSNSL